MDLINRQDVINMIMEDGIYCDTDDDKKYSAERIMSLPTVEPKRGKWIMVEDADEDGNARYECSLCHAGETHTPKVKVSYCWNCGARMEE